MNIRDALIQMAPSLTLQRAAADAIAVLDKWLSDTQVCLLDAEFFIQQEGLSEKYVEWLKEKCE